MAKTPAKANQFLSVMKVLSGWALVSDKIAQSMVEGVRLAPSLAGTSHGPLVDAFLERSTLSGDEVDN